jgi:hypothetical protein
MVVLWGGLALALGVGAAPAQLSEIIRGVVTEVPTDMFACDNGSMPCGLSYRMVPQVAPNEVNGPANPVDGWPVYRARKDRYLSDAQTTANFPIGSGMPGMEWYILWDGQTGAGTAGHAGWYGTQSQVINSFEIGNSTSFNCLPVVAQEACFAALDVLNGFNDTVRADGTPLTHVGGISPMPCPTLVQNGLATITYSWEEATNSTSRDGAAAGVVGYELFLAGNNETPTDMDLAMGGASVASEMYGTTMTTVDRGNLGVTPGLEGMTIYTGALGLDYVLGKESLYYSCNSAATGYGALGPEETGDASFTIDVQQAYVETRVRESDLKEFLVLTMDMVDVTVSKNLARYELFFATCEGCPPAEEFDMRAFPASSSRSKSDGAVSVLFKLNASFDAGETDITFDDDYGRVTFLIDADALAAALGQNTAYVTGDWFVRSARDRFTIGWVSF